MRLYKYSILLLSIIFLIIACNSEPTSTNPSDDATITSMYIQKNDSAPKASSAVFFVDDTNNTIINLDSLPYGTKIDSLYLGFTFGSSYGFVLNDTISEASYYSRGTTSKPLDLTKPVKVLNLATDGETTKEYTIKVLVHQVDPYLHVWENLNEGVKVNAPENQKAVLMDDKFYYFFSDKTELDLYTSTNAKDWTYMGNTTGLPTPVKLKNMQVLHSKIYLLNSDTIYMSSDGVNWTSEHVKGDSNYEYGELLFVFKDKLWAWAFDNSKSTIRIANSADGINWNFAGKRTFSDDFPVTAFAATSYQPPVGREKVIVVGGKSHRGDVLRSVWAAENILGTDTLNWINLQRPNKLLNNIFNASIGYYGSKLTLLGGETIKELIPDSLQLLQSTNEGLVWKIPNKDQIKLPTNFKKRSNASFIEDRKNNVLYIIGGESESGTLSDSWKIKVNFYNFDDYKTNPSKY